MKIQLEGTCPHCGELGIMKVGNIKSGDTVKLYCRCKGDDNLTLVGQVKVEEEPG